MKVRVCDYDCILLDLMLPGGNGLDILREIRKRHSHSLNVNCRCVRREKRSWHAFCS